MLFHLNLAYSSISEANRKRVIEQCYFPLLDLINRTNIPIGIEATAWTLDQINTLYPSWINAFRQLLLQERTELIGSGYTQLIGPLVPYAVNQWNQKIGLHDYQKILQIKPKLALINEMAYSTGLVEVYQNVGYSGIIMDRDNVRLSLEIEHHSDDQLPTHAAGLNDTALPVLWSDSILFQKLQRYVHGETRLIDYLNLFRQRATVFRRPLAIYCNDAEIFDYRPGRYKEESPSHHEGEWKRLEKLLLLLSEKEKVVWLSPSDSLKKTIDLFPYQKKILSSILQPIPVKKQAKYNISRWAITGRNDLWINTFCYRFYKAIQLSQDESKWRALCELWASDLRTHIEKNRWDKTCDNVNHYIKYYALNNGEKSSDTNKIDFRNTISNVYKIKHDDENILLSIQSQWVHLELNLQKGLTIHSVSFASHEFIPMIGTLPHGYFDSIQLGADFYSAGTVMELPSQHKRFTDFKRVEPIIYELNHELHIVGEIQTENGVIKKHYVLLPNNQSMSFSIEFMNWRRESCILRAGTLTFLPEALLSPITVKTCNGGSAMETFLLNQSCDHTAPASTLVSCTTGFGATTGCFVIGNDHRNLSITWDPAKAAIFPMLQHQKIGNSALLRLFFSLSELDETTHSGGTFLPFQITLQPVYKNLP